MVQQTGGHVDHLSMEGQEYVRLATKTEEIVASEGTKRLEAVDKELEKL